MSISGRPKSAIRFSKDPLTSLKTARLAPRLRSGFGPWSTRRCSNIGIRMNNWLPKTKRYLTKCKDLRIESNKQRRAIRTRRRPFRGSGTKSNSKRSCSRRLGINQFSTSKRRKTCKIGLRRSLIWKIQNWHKMLANTKLSYRRKISKLSNYRNRLLSAKMAWTRLPTRQKMWYRRIPNWGVRMTKWKRICKISNKTRPFC